MVTVPPAARVRRFVWVTVPVLVEGGGEGGGHSGNTANGQPPEQPAPAAGAHTDRSKEPPTPIPPAQLLAGRASMGMFKLLSMDLMKSIAS